MTARTRTITVGVAALTLAALVIAVACTGLKRTIVGVMTPDWAPTATEDGGFVAVFDERDAERPRIGITLTPVASGLVQPTDIQFVPGAPSLMVALEKSGRARWYDLETKRRGLLFEVPVLTDSEQGLLGLAFHPEFASNGRFYVNSTPEGAFDQITRVQAWSIPGGSDLRTARAQAGDVLLEVVQPYPNHNGGQLAFGPDGYLYIGLGDGGWRDDPHGHGQNTATMLGSMLRIDVDDQTATKPYGIPDDNPFLGKAGFAPELWAYGLRNPWRYSFDPRPGGGLIVADVGQDAYEEVSLLSAGDNAGWKIREAAHCFDSDEPCATDGLADPFYEYGRDEGGSITGGFVATGDHVPALRGRYVFADFLSGRLWATELPGATTTSSRAVAHTLGRWPFLPVTFGRDHAGRLYVAGYMAGTIWRLDP